MHYVLYNSGLVVWLLPELEANGSPCGPRLLTRLRRLTPQPLVAQQLIQAWRWDVLRGRPEVYRRLLALEQAANNLPHRKPAKHWLGFYR
jgi:hypothetical protein